jgi:hypothetical protein
MFSHFSTGNIEFTTGIDTLVLSGEREKRLEHKALPRQW